MPSKKPLPLEIKVILTFYTIGFIIGTYTHASGIFRNGFLAVAPDAPIFFNLYWDSLTVLDFIAAFLIWLRPKAGVYLAILIMITDISINSYTYTAGFFGPPVAGTVPIGLLLQSVFGTYVLVTAPLIFQKLRQTI